MDMDDPNVEILLNALSYVRENVDKLNEFTGELGKQPVSQDVYEDAVIAFMNTVTGEPRTS